MPKFFHEQADIIFAGVHTLILFSHGCPLFESLPHVDYILLFAKKDESSGQTNDQVSWPFRKNVLTIIEQKLAEKLIRFHRQYLKQNRRLINVLTTQFNIAFFYSLIAFEIYQIFVSNFQHVPSTRLILVTTASFFFFRANVTGIQIGFQFMCQNNIIQIKQKHYSTQLDVSQTDGRSFQLIHGHFRSMMAKVLDITREINAFNAHYSKYVSMTILLYTMIGCSVLNACVQKSQDAPFLQVMPWLFYSFVSLLNRSNLLSLIAFLSQVYLSIIFFLNAASSRTIYLNVRLFKRLRQFQIGLLSGKCLSKNQVVKLDLVNEYKFLLQKCAFKLVNSSTINNKFFFFQIYSAVSVFYLKLYSGELSL